MTDAEAETIKVGILIQSSNDTEKLKAKWALFAASLIYVITWLTSQTSSRITSDTIIEITIRTLSIGDKSAKWTYTCKSCTVIILCIQTSYTRACGICTITKSIGWIALGANQRIINTAYFTVGDITSWRGITAIWSID